jgi:hypothetical protein
MSKFNSPSGRVYEWNKPSDPTQEDIDALVAYDSKIGSQQNTAAPVGELRRREGAGEISALDQAVQESKPGFLDSLGGAIEAGTAAQQFSLPTDTPQQRSVNRAKGAGVIAGVVAPELAAMAAPSVFAAAPTAGFLGGASRVGSLAASGALSGAAQQGTEEALSGMQEGAGTRIAESTGLGAGLGALGAAVERYMPTAYLYAKNLLSPRKAAATLFRPFENPSVSQMAASDARRAIQDTTGIEVPIGVGEAVGTPELANNIKNIQAGSELSTESKDALKRQITFAATQLRNSGVTDQDLAKYTVNTLRDQIGDVSKPVKDAIESLSKELHPSIQSAFNDVQNQARALVPGTSATPTSFGNRVRNEIQGAFSDLSGEEKAAFQKVTSNPDYRAVTIPTTETRNWSNNLQGSTVQSVGGGATTSVMPSGTGKFASVIPDLESVQTLEQMRNFRTQVGSSIGNDAVFPGVSDYQKKQLYRAVSQDIENGISALPGSSLKTDLQQANALTKQKYGTFDNPMMDKILQDFGPEGGAGPASIATKLRSPDGPSFLEQIKKSVPPARAKAITDAASEYLFNEIGSAAKDSVTGEISAGKLLNGIDSLAPEIRNQFFPNYNKIVDLARKQNAVSKVDPKKIIDNLSVEDSTLLFDALGPTSSKSVMDKVSDAFAKSQKLQQQYNGTVVGALAKMDSDGLSELVQKNPSKFMRSIMDGETFSPAQTEQAMRVIATHNPKLINDLQFSFVNDLLSRSTGQGRISANNLLKELVPESTLGKAGRLRGVSEAVLGAGKLDSLESTLRSLAEIEKAGGDVTSHSPLIDLLARGTGAAIGSAVRGSSGIGTLGAANELAAVAGRGQKIKYAIASYILTTPELRKLAVTPINRIDPMTAKAFINGFSNFAIEHFGPDSPEADEIHTMNIDANRRGQ